MLQGKTVLISGSSRGIGAATARLAKEYGAEVILHGKTESPELVSLGKELGASYILCDVANESEVSEAFRKISHLDVLVNCAGITNPKSFAESTEEDWLNVFRINVLGTVNFCKAALPLFQKQGTGRIVNIASIRGYGIISGRAAYSTSKAAIINLTCTLAKEYAPAIAVNAIAPGFTNTDMAKTWDEGVWKQVRSALLERIGEPKEIAEAICFLGSEKASFITGQTLLVDGGYSIAGK
ncbi:MAG: SDR family NAD(P)-dependent oxidoreductase [Patescibacteria group bacterium]